MGAIQSMGKTLCITRQLIQFHRIAHQVALCLHRYIEHHRAASPLEATHEGLMLQLL